LLALEQRKSVFEMTHSMTAAEEVHWLALHQEAPIGYDRIDAGLAQIALILAAINDKTPKPSKTFNPVKRTLTDFMLFYRKPVKAQEDVEGGVRSFFESFKKD
jgi:hypothetical protein